MPIRTTHTERRAARVLALPAVALVALGALWAHSRLAPRETPRWTPGEFTALTEARGAPAAWDERWVVAYHPGCPHCAASLASVATARDAALAPIRITALIVDAAAAPAESLLARLPADETWWDSGGRWRGRWRHAVYGEVACFDAHGNLLRILPPFAAETEARRRLATLGLEALPD